MSSTQNNNPVLFSRDGDDIAFINNGQTAVVFSNADRYCDPCTSKPVWNGISPTLSVPGSPEVTTVNWLPNLEPRRLVQAVYADPDAPAMLRNKRRNLMGQKILPVCYGCDGPTVVPQYMNISSYNRWNTKNRYWFNKFMRQRAVNLTFFRMSYTLGIHHKGDGRTIDFGSIKSLHNIDAMNVLAVQMNPGETEPSHYVVVSRNGHKVDWKVIPAFDFENPRKHGVWIHQTRDHVPGCDYYAYPDYVGALPQLQLRRQFTEYHISGFKNGWNVKYVACIPMELVEDLHAHKCESKKAGEPKPTLEDVRQSLTKELDQYLSGQSANQSTIITFSKIHDGKEVKINIEPIQNYFKGEEYIKLAEFVNRNLNLPFDNSSVLSGKNNENKIGGTGSEVFRFQNIENTTNAFDDRKMYLEIMDVLTEIQNWRSTITNEEHKHFEWDVYAPNMTTLDLARSGEVSPIDPLTSSNPN